MDDEIHFADIPPRYIPIDHAHQVWRDYGLEAGTGLVLLFCSGSFSYTYLVISDRVGYSI